MKKPKKKNPMADILLVLVFVVVWYIFQGITLPKMGVDTWVSSACDTEDRWSAKDKTTTQEQVIEQQKPGETE